MKDVILITGSSRGIGKAIARKAYERGYTVIIHGKTDSEALRNTENELPGVHKVVFDVGNRDETQRELSKILEKVGTIDVLVNNAGIAKNLIKDIREVDEDFALEEWRTNVLGPIHCIQAILPGMRENGYGSIINIASIK